VRDRTETIDPRLVKALSHPLRIQILDVLSERIASPNWLSDRLDATLSHVAYHTRTLNQCGCLSLVDTAQKRGATEHFYKAAPGSYVSSRVWRRVPQAILGGVSGATLQSFMDRAVAALEAGTIDAREDTVLTWMPLLLDRRGWEEVVSVMEEATDRVLEAQQKSDQRVADADIPPQTISTIAGLASFETGGSRPT